jgi:isopentenyl diphosphate isomerase/L-lactate dehydrogenase-like FMN-dependent dehydrogenase
LDGLICHALGADLFSAAVPFLKAAMDSPEAVISLLHLWQQGLQIALFASGAVDWAAARSLQLDAAKS